MKQKDTLEVQDEMYERRLEEYLERKGKSFEQLVKETNGG